MTKVNVRPKTVRENSVSAVNALIIKCQKYFSKIFSPILKVLDHFGNFPSLIVCQQGLNEGILVMKTVTFKGCTTHMGFFTSRLKII